MKLLEPHDKKSRIAIEADLPNILETGKEIFKILNQPLGMYNRHWSCSHAQVCDSDPIRFFVLNSVVEKISKEEQFIQNELGDKKTAPINVWEIIINPVIVRHSSTTVDSKEGCLTFPEMPMIIKQRWHKIEMEYSFIVLDSEGKPHLSERKTAKLKGDLARVCQHEIDHFSGKYIY